MRSVTTTLILVAVLAGLGGYIYFVESERDPNATEAKAKAFDGISADDIEEITITSSDKETTRLRKSGERWRLVEPVETGADAGELTTIAGALATLDIQRVVEEQAADLTPFGLAQPRVDVSFRKAGDTTVRRILIGDKTPTGGELYAKLPDSPRVFLVSSYLDASFNKGTFALRDKRVLEMDREKVDGLEASAGTEVLQFGKSGSEWMVLKPIRARADYAAVEGAIERLNAVQMQSIADPAPADLATFGLNAPTAAITVVAGSARSTLTLGGMDGANVFAKDAARPMVFSVAPTVRTDLIKAVGEYRRKDMFDARSFTATRVELTQDTRTIVLEKTKGSDGKEAWKTGTGTALDTAKAEDLLTKLSSLRALSFDDAADAALKAPALVATVRFESQKTETVTFARSATRVVAARGDEPGSATIDTTAFDDMVKALAGVK